MSHHLSPLGIFHTAVSVLPIFLGAAAFINRGRIDPRAWAGKGYLATMLIGSLTAFGISKNGGFNFGHVLSLTTILLLAVGYAAGKSRRFPRLAEYVETFSMSATYLLLMVFTTTETLTRLPVEHPIASGIDAPILETVRQGLLVAFLAVVAYQAWTIRESHARQRHLAALDVYVTRVVYETAT